MNKVTEIFETSKSPSEFSRNYFNYLSEVFSKISEVEVGNFISLILDARDRGAQIFFMGNGGSSATADHFVNDIAIGTRTTGKPFRTYSLCSNMSSLTAIANDDGYEYVFIKQLRSLMRPGDVVIGISASGNSPNILNALEFAASNEAITVGITGFDGGKMKSLAKYSVHVPTAKGEYGPVEDIHMIFDHILGNYLAYYCKMND